LQASNLGARDFKQIDAILDHYAKTHELSHSRMQVSTLGQPAPHSVYNAGGSSSATDSLADSIDDFETAFFDCDEGARETASVRGEQQSMMASSIYIPADGGMLSHSMASSQRFCMQNKSRLHVLQTSFVFLCDDVVQTDGASSVGRSADGAHSSGPSITKPTGNHITLQASNFITEICTYPNKSKIGMSIGECTILQHELTTLPPMPPAFRNVVILQSAAAAAAAVGVESEPSSGVPDIRAELQFCDGEGSSEEDALSFQCLPLHMNLHPKFLLELLETLNTIGPTGEDDHPLASPSDKQANKPASCTILIPRVTLCIYCPHHHDEMMKLDFSRLTISHESAALPKLVGKHVVPAIAVNFQHMSVALSSATLKEAVCVEGTATSTELASITIYSQVRGQRAADAQDTSGDGGYSELAGKASRRVTYEPVEANFVDKNGAGEDGEAQHHHSLADESSTKDEEQVLAAQCAAVDSSLWVVDALLPVMTVNLPFERYRLLMNALDGLTTAMGGDVAPADSGDTYGEPVESIVDVSVIVAARSGYIRFGEENASKGSDGACTYSIDFSGLEVFKALSLYSAARSELDFSITDFTLFEAPLAPPGTKAPTMAWTPILYKTKWGEDTVNGGDSADPSTFAMRIESGGALAEFSVYDTLVNISMRHLTWRQVLESTWMLRIIGVLFAEDEPVEGAPQEAPPSTITQLQVSVGDSMVDYIPADEASADDGPCVGGHLVVSFGNVELVSCMVSGAAEQGYKFAMRDIQLLACDQRRSFELDDAMLCSYGRSAIATSPASSWQQFLDQEGFVRLGEMDYVEAFMRMANETASAAAVVDAALNGAAAAAGVPPKEPEMSVKMRASVLRLYSCADSLATMTALLSQWYLEYTGLEAGEVDMSAYVGGQQRQQANKPSGGTGVQPSGSGFSGGFQVGGGVGDEMATLLDGIEENAFGMQEPTVAPADTRVAEGDGSTAAPSASMANVSALLIDDYYCMSQQSSALQPNAEPASPAEEEGGSRWLDPSASYMQGVETQTMGDDTMGFEPVDTDEESSTHGSALLDSGTLLGGGARDMPDEFPDGSSSSTSDAVPPFGEQENNGMANSWWARPKEPVEMEMDAMGASRVEIDALVTQMAALDDLDAFDEGPEEGAGEEGANLMASSMFFGMGQGGQVQQIELDLDENGLDDAHQLLQSMLVEQEEGKGEDGGEEEEGWGVGGEGMDEPAAATAAAFYPPVGSFGNSVSKEESAFWFGADADANTGQPNGAPPAAASDAPNLRIYPHHIQIPTETERDAFGAKENPLGTRARKGAAGPVVLSFLLQELCIKWRIFGGHDWALSRSGASTRAARSPPPPPQARGASADRKSAALMGALLDNYEPSAEATEQEQKKKQQRSRRAVGGRRTDCMLEVELQEVKLRYEAYAEDSNQEIASHMVMAVKELEIHDYISTSAIKRLLGFWRSDTHHMRVDGTNMLSLCMTAVRPSGEGNLLLEYRVAAELLPLRVNLDQEALTFFQQWAENSAAAEELAGGGAPQPQAGSAAGTTLGADHLNVNAVGVATSGAAQQGGSSGAVDSFFFQSCDVQGFKVKIDYQPQRFNLELLKEGQYAELVNLFPLEGMELTMRHVKMCGIAGWGGIGDGLVTSWINDISRKQIHKCIASVSGGVPLRSITNIGAGAADLVLIPLEQYRRDRRLVRGLKRGATSFMRAFAVETLTTATKVVQGAEAVLKCAGEIPGASSAAGAQPANAREGFKKAYEKLQGAAQTIIAVPVTEYQRTGPNGGLKCVIRAVPIAVVGGLAGVTGAASAAMMGVRNELDPEVRADSEAKYKDQRS
jgi:hypothetical protein